MNYRTELFKLCKKLQKDKEAQKIQRLVHDMSVSIENQDTGFFKDCLHGGFAYLAKQSNSQFQGYLYVDEHLNGVELPIPLKAERVTESERALLERGHRTLLRFVELCLEELKVKENLVADAANPYFLFPEVSFSTSAAPLLSDEELQPAVRAFQTGKAYQAMLAFDLEKMFEKLQRQDLQKLIAVMEREIGQSYDEEEVPEDIQKFSLRLNAQRDKQDAASYLMSGVIILAALKSSLTIGCQMLYEAICGGDLIVLDNDNVISIEKSTSNTLFRSCKVLMQGLYVSTVSQGVRNVVLLDCDPSETRHLHEFGMVIGMTESVKRDLGATTRFTFVILDDEMNPIHNLTNHIIRTRIPEMRPSVGRQK